MRTRAKMLVIISTCSPLLVLAAATLLGAHSRGFAQQAVGEIVIRLR